MVINSKNNTQIFANKVDPVNKRNVVFITFEAEKDGLNEVRLEDRHRSVCGYIIE